MFSVFGAGIDVAPAFDPTARAVLAQRDCLDALRETPDGFAKLIITSPPYNIGKAYEQQEDDWLPDPFAGVGSALLAALRHNRRAMGCERDAAYVETARERIVVLSNGTLPYRPLGKPVHQPTGREKVSQRPREWSITSAPR